MTLCVIPARLNSSRFPNKVITPIAGRELILRVIDTCLTCDRLKKILILAQDEAICDLVFKEFKSIDKVIVQLHKFGESGTHRAFDYYYRNKFFRNKMPMVVVQADNISLTTNDLDTIVLEANIKNDQKIYTPICEIDSFNAGVDSNVKVVVDNLFNVLYFSRSKIPYNSSKYYKHIGVYMFPYDILNNNLFMSYAIDGSFNNCQLSIDEKLEQLAWLYYGFGMRAILLDGYRHSIDTIDDMESYIRSSSF